VCLERSKLVAPGIWSRRIAKPSAVIFILGLLLGATSAAAQSGNPWFETVPETAEFGDGIYTAIAQDARGLLWFGSIGGLLRFDGYRTTRFRQGDGRQGLAGSYVRSLLALPDGRLLIGTQGNGIILHDPDLDGFSPGPSTFDGDRRLANDAVLAMALAREGGVWIATATAGLRHWNGQDNATRRIDLPIQTGRDTAGLTVRALLVDRAGNVWVGTTEGLFRRAVDSDRFEAVLSSPEDEGSLHRQYVYSLMQDSSGRIWIGTQADGLAWTAEDGAQLNRLPLDDDPDLAPHEWISGVVEPSPGSLWVFTYGHGVVVLDVATLGRTGRVMHDPALAGGLPMDRVLAPMLDRSRLLWIGTWGSGVIRHNPTAGAFRSLRFSVANPAGPSQRSLLSLLELPDGSVWVGTAGNGVDEFGPDLRRRGGFRPQPERPGHLQDGMIRALAATSDGSVWVGTHQAGLHRYRADRNAFELRNEGLPDRRIRRLLALDDGSLAVGTQRGGVIVQTMGEEARPLHLEDGRAITDPIWAISKGPDASLWISTPTRLLYRRHGDAHFKELASASDEAASASAIGDLAMDSRGTLWALGSGGLFRLQGWNEGRPQMAPWSSSQGPLPTGGNLAIDRQDRLWTPRHRIDPISGEVIAFGRADGAEVGNFELGAAGQLRDGRLAFAGTLGLLVIDPDSFSPWRYAPPLAVTSLQIGGVEAGLNRLAPELRLEPEERRISLEFAALDFSAPASNRYAFRLDGQDPDWITTTADYRMATYSNLWPGDYILRIRGSGRDGEWSPNELAIPITVAPLWWQTRTFLLLLLIGIALLVFGLLQLRVHQVRQHARELQRLVAERTAALSQAKQATEDTLDHLRETQQQLVEAEKLASLGQLVAGVAHEINTPVGVAVTAASHLRDLSAQIDEEVEQGKLSASHFEQWRETVRTASKLLLSSLERTHSLVGSFRQLAVQQNSEERSEFTLDELFRLTISSLKAAAHDAGHVLEVNCAEDICFDSYPGVVLQCIAKCVQNAIDHAFEPVRRGTIGIVARKDGGQAVIEVTDNGRGMSPEVRAKAFDPFFTTQRGKGATGLGLHLVYHQTRHLLGGQAEIESEPGQGTRIRLRLPLHAP